MEKERERRTEEEKKVEKWRDRAREQEKDEMKIENSESPPPCSDMILQRTRWNASLMGRVSFDSGVFYATDQKHTQHATMERGQEGWLGDIVLRVVCLLCWPRLQRRNHGYVWGGVC